jgi:hypothetical protein
MKIVVFDLDETLGYFTEFGIFWDSLNKIIKLNNQDGKNDKSLSQEDFNDVLDLYPEFLRPNIINILTYLKTKKTSKCCHNMMIYTNNTGPREWVKYITKYFEKKIDYNLFDQIISAFKVNGKQIEVCRTTHDKTHQDFIRCTKLPENVDICFLDDTFYPGMENERIYYINCKPYYYDISFTDLCARFMDSHVSKKILSESYLFSFEENMNNYFKLYRYKYIEKVPKEYEIDKIVGKYIIKHLKIFFNEKQQQQNKTMKKYRNKQKNKTKHFRKYS